MNYLRNSRPSQISCSSASSGFILMICSIIALVLYCARLVDADCTVSGNITAEILKPWQADDIAFEGTEKLDVGCYNQTLKVPDSLHIPPFEMCLRGMKGKKDLISEKIKEVGYWDDCFPLRHLWHKAVMLAIAAGSEKEHAMSEGLVVDVGGNIGSCSLLLAAAGAKVVAFEPHPSNLFYFSRGAQMNVANGLYTADKVSIYPYGCGSVDAELQLFAQKGNAGHAILNVVHSDLTYRAPTIVKIFKLDDILWPERCSGAKPPKIHLLKVDAEGFELEVLRGAADLLKAKTVRFLKMELDSHHLQLQGATCYEVCRMLSEDYGFTLATDEKGKWKVDLPWCARLDRTGGVNELVAWHSTDISVDADSAAGIE